MLVPLFGTFLENPLPSAPAALHSYWRSSAWRTSCPRAGAGGDAVVVLRRIEPIASARIRHAGRVLAVARPRSAADRGA
jgi:hypothetical protein